MSGGKRPVFAAIVIILILCLGTTASGAVSTSIRILVDNKQIETDAKIIDGSVYVPVDTIAAHLGADVSWDKQNGTVKITASGDITSEVIKKVSPSVVGIIGKLKVDSQEYSPYGDNLVFGTGVIYRSNGYIITNAHVVIDMDEIVVVLSTGKSYKARLKLIDEPSDLAIIKIDKGELPVAEFGNMSDIVVGDQVVAIGTPLSFSLRNSATKGIIGGLNRTVEGEYSFIQSDAAINGGNSGGPLVNMAGKVIGINTVKYTGYGVEGLNFSIPVDTVKYVIEHFENYGRVRRPFTGITFDEGILARFGLPSEEGLTVSAVEDDSPAFKAGICVDDVVTAVNGIKVNTKISYNAEMKKYLPGTTIKLTIIRNDELKDVSIVCGESN